MSTTFSHGNTTTSGLRCLGLLTALAVALGTGCQATAVHAQSSEGPLLHKEDLVYLGAFRVPRGGPDTSTLDYGGRALAYNAENNSLFLLGHDHHQKSAEISIPAVVDSDKLSDLATAQLLQGFHDSTDGRRRQINPDDKNSQKIGGHLVYRDKLVVSAFSNYDARGTQRASHFSRSMNLGDPSQTVGPVAVGDHVHFTSAYMALVPQEWQDAFGGPALTGNCCRSIIGYQSHGPSVSTFNPDQIGKRDHVPSRRLLYYTEKHPLGPGGSTKNSLFNLTTRVEGVVFPQGTRSVLFFGHHGTGEYCYGEAERCGDPAKPDKGTHAYPYAYQVWAYDAEDLAAVAKGRSLPYRVLPYSVWNFTLPFEKDNRHAIGGVAYDRASSKIYLSQLRGDKKLPVIHAFRIRLTVDHGAK